MPFSLPGLRRVAAAIAAEEDAGLTVLGTTRAEGSADYAEVLFAHAASAVSDSVACIVITVKREIPEADMRSALRDGLRAHLRAMA